MSEQLKLGGGIFERWNELDAKVLAALRSAGLTEREKEVLRVIAGHSHFAATRNNKTLHENWQLSSTNFIIS